jgi:hypothetical protein
VTSAFFITRRVPAPSTYKKESQTIMGNKDRRKEKKKPKQPKETPKTSNQAKLGGSRPSK